MHIRQRTLPGHVDLMHILNGAVSTDLKWTSTELGTENGGCDTQSGQCRKIWDNQSGQFSWKTEGSIIRPLFLYHSLYTNILSVEYRTSFILSLTVTI